MTSKIRQIGNSHGIVIPKKLLEEVGLKAGDEVELIVEYGSIFVVKKGHKLSESSLKYHKIISEFYKNNKTILDQLNEEN